MDGWIKLHRKVLDNPVVMKDSEYFQIWIYLLLKASHTDYPAMFKGKKIVLKPGQLITGRKRISSETGISESKIFRVLNVLKIEHQIEQQTSNKNSLISIVHWDEYQQIEQQNEQLLNNNRTTTEHKQEYKEYKELKKDILYSEITNLFSLICVSYSKVGRLTDKRIKLIDLLLEKYSKDDVQSLFTKAEQSDFLKGKNKNGWKATFDWLVKPENADKVLSGTYDNQPDQKQNPGFNKMGNNRIYDFAELEKEIRAN